MDGIHGSKIVIFADLTDEKEMIKTSILMELLGNENMMGRMHRCGCRHLSKNFRNYIHHAAKKMNKKIKARMRRDVLVNIFEHSDEDALRVFANQLYLVKYE